MATKHPPPALSAINAVPRKSHSFWEASMKVYHIHAVHISAKQGSYLKIIIDICIIVSLSLQRSQYGMISQTQGCLNISQERITLNYGQHISSEHG